MLWQGYRAEMDNTSLSNILPSVLRNKKEELFGNLPEIYKFHSRWEMYPHTWTHKYTFMLIRSLLCRIFLQDLESCLETPERVGASFLERVSHSVSYCIYKDIYNDNDKCWSRILKKLIKVYTKILSSTAAFNIDENKKCYRLQTHIHNLGKYDLFCCCSED